MRWVCVITRVNGRRKYTWSETFHFPAAWFCVLTVENYFCSIKWRLWRAFLCVVCFFTPLTTDSFMFSRLSAGMQYAYYIESSVCVLFMAGTERSAFIIDCNQLSW
jgi:hypothetical protein